MKLFSSQLFWRTYTSKISLVLCRKYRCSALLRDIMQHMQCMPHTFLSRGESETVASRRMLAAVPAKARLRATLPRTCLEASMLGQLIERGEFLYTLHERGLSLEEKGQFSKLVGEGSKEETKGRKRRWRRGGVFRHFGTTRCYRMPQWIHYLVAQAPGLSVGTFWLLVASSQSRHRRK